MAETSDRISSMAARYRRIEGRGITNMTLEQHIDLASDIRSMAASLQRQDETRGLRGLFRKIVGA